MCVTVLALSACRGDPEEAEGAASSTPSASGGATSPTGLQTAVPSPGVRTDYDLPPYDELVRLFDYDTSEPLAYEVGSSERERGATVHRVTYQSSGYDVPAYLVVPEGRGPFPAVLYAHGYSVGPDWFLPDAIALAREGYAGLLIQYPGTREPLVSFVSCDARSDVEGNVQYVIDLRRGLDLLQVLPEIDSQRVGFVGHSLGAGVGAILPGLEGARIDAFVIMDGGAYTSEAMMEDCGSLPDEERVAYQEGMAVLNPANFIGHDLGAALLFQVSTYHESPFATEMALVELAPEPKTLIEYEDFNHVFGCYDFTLCDPRLPPYVDHRAWLQENV
jgi:pimeloyl-ACP methyl ester carboxylesterase